MRYLNEEQSQQFDGLLRPYASEHESLTIRAGRTIVYRGTPGGENPEIDRITPQQLENLSNALNHPSQSTGSIKISKEQSYQVQNGQQIGNNTISPLDRSQKPPSQSASMAQLLSVVAELKQHSVAQSELMATWERELVAMRETIARQEKLLKQATTPVHKRLGNWFDGQKERIGNWLDQQQERCCNRLEDVRHNIGAFKDDIQSRLSAAKQQIVTNIEEFRDSIKQRGENAKQQLRNNIDGITGVAELRQEVRRLQETLRFQQIEQQKLNQELRLNQVTEVKQPASRVEAQQVQAVPATPKNNEYLDKSLEIQLKEIAQLSDSQKANFNRLVSQLERDKLVEFRADLIEKKQFDPGTPLVPQYLEFKQGQEKQRLATELASRHKYSRPPVLQLTLGGGNSGPDPWQHLAKAPEELQIRSGIIPPINITPAGAQWYSQFVADGKRLQAEEMITAEKERLKEAGFSPKQIESREKDIREKAFGQVGEQWKLERAEALKKWQESKAVNSFQAFVQTQPALTQSEPQKISSPENSTSLESDKQATSLASDKPYGPVLVLNNNGNVRCQHQEPKPTPEARGYKELIQSCPAVTKDLSPLNNKPNTRLDNFEQVLTRANNPKVEQQAQLPSTPQVSPENNNAAQLRQSTKTPEQAAGTTIENSQKQQPLQQVTQTQATKNSQQPQQLHRTAEKSLEKQQSQQQSIPQVQNGTVQNGATPQRTSKTEIENKGQESVSVQDLKQWRFEAEALEIHGPGYLNKIDKLTELAEQKVASNGSNGRVTLKEPDAKRMQADRQEFKQLGQEQAQTQSRGMRM